MKVSEFDYKLPKELIADTPASPRDSSRLLILDRASGEIAHKHFSDLPDLLCENDVLVVNNSMVIPARLLGKTKNGAHIEVFLVRPTGESSWECLIKTNVRKKIDIEIYFESSNLRATVKENKGYTYYVDFNKKGEDFWNEIERIGHVPLPPYIRKGVDQIDDKEKYQTVYAREDQRGSVAAPTAGLHFTKSILDSIRKKGIKVLEVTLHVGLGTFLPVKSEEVEDHVMHEEYGYLDSNTAMLLNSYKEEGKRIIAVGTTSVRVLETFYNDRRKEFVPGEKWIDIFIYPGYKFKSIDCLITNFHLPKSTLLMLVCAFAGKEIVLSAYEEAKKEKYRFFSYGDAMFIK